MYQQESGIRQFSDVFFIYVQQGEKHYVDRMDAHQHFTKAFKEHFGKSPSEVQPQE